MENVKRSYGIRCCESSKCRREQCDRDVNASINILFKLLWLLRGEEIPLNFKRGVDLNVAVVEEDAGEADNTVDEILIVHE